MSKMQHMQNKQHKLTSFFTQRNVSRSGGQSRKKAETDDKRLSEKNLKSKPSTKRY